jgi:hypothetical protein
VGCLFTSDTHFAPFKWRASDGRFETGPFFAEGSGADTLRNQFERRRGVSSEIAHKILLGIEAVGLLLAHEIIEGANITSYFGGGFDIVYYDGAVFRRPASIVHSFFDMKLRDDGLGFGLGQFPTSFWQTFGDEGWTVERVDFSDKPLRPNMTLKSKIEKATVAQIPLRKL